MTSRQFSVTSTNWSSIRTSNSTALASSARTAARKASATSVCLLFLMKTRTAIMRGRPFVNAAAECNRNRQMSIGTTERAGASGEPGEVRGVDLSGRHRLADRLQVGDVVDRVHL